MSSFEEISIEKDFILFRFQNNENEKVTFQKKIAQGLIQFHFVLKVKGKFIINQGGYSIDLNEEKSMLFYVVLDLNIDGSSGLRLIEPLLAANPDCRILVLTGYASIATTVDAIKLGAIQYLAEPADVDAILKALQAGDVIIDDELNTSPMSIDRLEWEHIQRVLGENDGNISATARALKMHRRTLQRKLAKRPVKE